MSLYSSDLSRQQCDDYGPLPSWDDDSAFGGQYNDGNDHSDVEDSSTLVSQPRQVVFFSLLHNSVLELTFVYVSEPWS